MNVYDHELDDVPRPDPPPPPPRRPSRMWGRWWEMDNSDCWRILWLLFTIPGMIVLVRDHHERTAIPKGSLSRHEQEAVTDSVVWPIRRTLETPQPGPRAWICLLGGAWLESVEQAPAPTDMPAPTVAVLLTRSSVRLSPGTRVRLEPDRVQPTPLDGRRRVLVLDGEHQGRLGLIDSFALSESR